MISQYSFGIRCAHWLLARISLFQSVCLLLWLGERAYHETEPPISPWMVYAYIGIGLIASAGITSRFLTRLSLTIVLLSQLYIVYLFCFEKRLGYSKCLRARVSLRCLTTIGIYFRLLGVNGDYNDTVRKQSGLLNNSNNNFHKINSTTNLYAFGLTVMSISLCLLGIFCIPIELFQLDKDIQLTEVNSTLFLSSESYLCKLLSFILGICLLIASIIYSIPVIIHDKLLLNNTLSYKSNLFYYADYLIGFAFLVLSLLRDCNFNYWHIKGCEFWLEIRVLFENVTILLGIFVINHLLTTTTPSTTTTGSGNNNNNGNISGKCSAGNCKLLKSQ
ncbi:Haloacid dehalogenase-like hydrolase domain-containing 3 isoform 2 [Schistosoma japonicum]|uniref:Haloacid dehalogenase-like hydrolase domain-containing 3 isoform 2 n=1 Tax=Schistosoma japonicum TaxID=6182 RepID=A0A4Z2DTF9_SCHJA|nr:Haloacid dehalogenase-like hydrolase domain-containing 3 isoform 2 [Schistosoma japonicum]